MTRPAPEFVRMIPTKRLGDSGHTVHIQASTAECQQLAQAFDLIGISRLEAEVNIRRWRGPKGLAVDGTLSADVTQTCIVSLDDLPAQVVEPFQRRFLRAELLATEGSQEDVLVDPEADDPPDPWDGDAIDIGALVAEHFALGLDPYPRKPGVSIEKAQSGPKSRPKADLSTRDDELAKRPNPFAILKDRFPKA